MHAGVLLLVVAEAEAVAAGVGHRRLLAGRPRHQLRRRAAMALAAAAVVVVVVATEGAAALLLRHEQGPA
jgi:hypothetical protein